MQGYDSRYWLELMFRRRATALQVGGVVFGLIVLGTLLWPPAYNSTAKILVQDNRAQYLVSPDLQNASPQKPTVVANPVNEEALNSEVELLTSTFLIKQALANLPEPSDYSTPTGALMSAFDSAMDLPVLGYNALHDTPTLTSRDQWALKLERHLSAFVVKRSDIIEVGFNAHDPKWSKNFLERLLNEYLAYHARLSQDPEAQKFFQTQSQQLQKQLEGSEEKLRAFEVQYGITDLPAQKQALVNRLSGLQAQYERVTAQVASAHEQTSTLAGELRDTPERIAKETRSVQNLALQNLKPQVAKLQAERGELLSRYQPTSQRIQEIDAKLAAAQKILNQENHLEVQERSTDLNPIWVTVDSNLERSRTNQAAVEAGQKTLSDEIKAGHDELTRMVNNAVVVDRLERQVANDKEAYLSFVRKAEEARTAEALNLNKILNVSVAQPPTMPLRPVFPKVWLNLIAGLVLAVGLGIGAAYLEEQQDERIYAAATIADVSGLATVAVLPEQD